MFEQHTAHPRRIRETRQMQSVWCVVETTSGSSSVAAVRSDEDTAKLVAKVLRARRPQARINVSGPHLVTGDYV